MRLLLKTLFLIFALLLTSSIVFAKNRNPNYRQYTISNGINAILNDRLNNKFDGVSIGIVVQSMKTGKTLYQLNASRLFTPASVQKLLTAAAALDYLTPDFVFHTQLLSKGKIVKHALQGNLTLKFNGDPELTSDDLNKLFQQLHRKLGIRKIKGELFIDNTAYGTVPYPPGWLWDDLSYSFAAPLKTIIIDKNYFVLYFVPPRKNQTRPSLKAALPDGVATFSNGLIRVKRLRKDCPISIYSNNQNQYHIQGCFHRYWRTQSRKLAIRNMVIYTKVLIRQLLKKNNIDYKGPIGIKRAPKAAVILVQHDSPPLRDVIKQMLKESDNLTTNAVLKKLGQTYYRRRGTWQNSLRALKKLLSQSTKIDFSKNLINDGAGLSRYNLMSPQELSKVLYFAYHKSSINNAFANALPIAGNDGTMQYRLLSFAKSKRIIAKTGTMTGVTALAGYIRTKNNGPVSFVIMINGVIKPRKPYIKLQNEICKFLVNAKGNPKNG